VAGRYHIETYLLLPAIIAAIAFGVLAAGLASKNSRRAFYVASFLIFSILGIISFQLHQNPGILDPLEGREVKITGRIASHPQRSGQYRYFKLSARLLESEGNAYNIRGEVDVRVITDASFSRDDTVMVEGTVQSGTVECREVRAAGSKRFTDSLFNIRKRVYGCLKDTYNKYLGHGFAAVCEALVLGNRSGMPEGMVYDFKGAGIYHVLAISGLHISILAYFLMYMLRKTPGWFACLVVMAILLSFNFIVGLKASLLRASSMMLMVMLARAWGRHYRIGDILFTCFAFLLLLIPSYFTDLGFWLSFISFASIIFIAPMFEGLLGWPKNYFLRIIVISFSIGLAALPVNAYFFGMFSVASIVSNLAILPVFYVFMVMLFSISFLIILWPPLGGLLVLLKPFLVYITRTAYYINRLDFAKINFSGFPAESVVIYYVLLFFLLLLLYKYLWARDNHGQK